jgi:hypothetical protein
VRKSVRLTPVLLVALAVLAVASCQRTVRQPVVPMSTPGRAATPTPTPVSPAAVPTRTAEQKPSAAPGAQPAGAQKPNPGAITLAPQSPSQPAVTPVSSAPASSLLAASPTGRILPEDFKIGVLGDPAGSRKDQQGAMTAAAAFLDALTAGKVDAGLLTADARATVADSLSYGLDHGEKPTSFRISAPRTRDDGGITAAVRLFAAGGSTEGEIYMERAGDQWLVADVQVSLAGLLVKREPPREKFFPSAYRWLLED